MVDEHKKDFLRNALHEQTKVTKNGITYNVQLLIGIQTADFADGEFYIGYEVTDKERVIVSDYVSEKPDEVPTEEIYETVFKTMSSEIIHDSKQETHPYTKGDLKKDLMNFRKELED